MDVGVELVDDAAELLDLGRCVELRLVAHEVVETAVGLRVLRSELEEVELRADVDGGGRHARAGTTRPHRRDRAGCRAALGGRGSRGCGGSAGRRCSCPSPSSRTRSAAPPSASKLHPCSYRGSPKVPPATMALLSGRTRLRSSSQPSSPSACPGGEGQGIGAVLDLLAQGGTGLGEGAVRLDPTPRAQPRRRPRPRRRRPTGDCPGAPSAEPRRTRRGTRARRGRRARLRRGTRCGRRRGTRAAA